MGRLRVAVLGPGGVGGLLAAVLARDGAEVCCLAPAPSATVIAMGGISVESARFGHFSVRVDASSYLDRPIDVLVVAVKATALESALGQVPPELVGSAPVVPVLNGIEHVAVLHEHLPAAHLVPGAIRIESVRVGPGRIVHRSPFAAVDLAPEPADRGVLAPLVELLTSAGFEVVLRDNAHALLWEKLGFMAAFALLTTVYQAPAGTVRTTHRDRLASVIGEVVAVARAEKVALSADELLGRFDGLPATMESSMQRDAADHRPIELEAIGGAVVRAAARHGLAVPELSALVDELRSHPST